MSASVQGSPEGPSENESRPLRLLVTGGAGFIGSALIRQLIAETRHEVINLDALTYAALPGALGDAAASSRYRFVHGDIRDRALLYEVFAAWQPQAVMHLAAESHVDRSIDGPGLFVATNITGTAHMLEAALAYWRGLDTPSRAAFRFLQGSTDEVYGSLEAPQAASERSPYAPASPYAASKAAGDHLVRAWHRTYGLPVLLTHGANSYGAFQYPEKLVPRMIEAALAGRPLPIYGNGRQIRDWLHVDDHARAIRRVLAAGRVGQSYNVAAGTPMTNIALVRALCEAVDRQAPHAAPSAARLAYVADRPGHDQRYALDTRRIRETLGWQPRVALADGLADTVRWHLAHRELFAGLV